MINKLEFNFSQAFEGIIWKLLKVEEHSILLLEVREPDKHEARFSAFDYRANKFLWKDILFEEPWWIGLAATTSDVMLLNLYLNLENPDEKGLMAFHVHEQKILWRNDFFCFSSLEGEAITGYLVKDDFKSVKLDVNSGENLQMHDIKNRSTENISVIKPFQYVESNSYFGIVKSFITEKLNVMPVSGVEYLEYHSFIMISYYVQQDNCLANYLIVMTKTGETVLHDKLGQSLKGIGLETFFILSGCLFFVRNKCELVSFKIV